MVFRGNNVNFVVEDGAGPAVGIGDNLAGLFERMNFHAIRSVAGPRAGGETEHSVADFGGGACPATGQRDEGDLARRQRLTIQCHGPINRDPSGSSLAATTDKRDAQNEEYPSC